MRRPSTLLASVAALAALTVGAWTVHKPDTDNNLGDTDNNLGDIDNNLGGSRDRITRTGIITGWSISDDGTVSIRLEGRHDNRKFDLWFATPANRTATTRFEDLVLQAVLAIGTKQDPTTVTVSSDTSNHESGAKPTDALPLQRLQKD